MKFAAIIPARHGSKRLKGKNTKALLGKPLICWTIESAIKSQFFSSILVSTNDSKVLEICSSYSDVETIIRPEDLCTDEASSDSMVSHCIQFLNGIDAFVLLQPTSPLRTEKHISGSIAKFSDGINNYDIDSLLSVSDRIIYGEQYVDICVKTGVVIPSGIQTDEITKRKYLNGAIYINAIPQFVERGTIRSDKTCIFEMESMFSVDVDTLSDFIESEKTMEEFGYC